MKKIVFALLFISAISGTAFGAIVYSGSQNVTLTGPNVNQQIDIAGSIDHWDDFTIYLNSMGMDDSTLSIEFSAMGMGTPGIVITTSGIATNLAYGDLIGSSSSFASYGHLSSGSGGFQNGGEFGPSGGYIGLRTDNDHYAWLHMLSQSNIGDGSHSVIFDGWAYEDVQDMAIKAGDTGLPAVPVPGALALGGLGVGLVACLRRRKAA